MRHERWPLSSSSVLRPSPPPSPQKKKMKIKGGGGGRGEFSPLPQHTPPPHISFNAVSPLFFSSSHRCAVDSDRFSPPFLSPRHDHLSANCGAIVFRGSAGRRRRRRRRRRGFGAQRTHAPFRGCSHSRRGGREKSLNLKPKPPTFPSPSSSRWGSKSKSVWENVCKEERGKEREK